MIKLLKVIYRSSGVAILKKSILILINRYKRKSVFKNNSLKEFSIYNKHVFFGYYDLDPISVDNKNILSLAVPKNNSTKVLADVGFFDIQKNKFQKIGKTNTWCWQQGARLRWSKKDSNIIIYNNLYKNQYGCVFQNITNKIIVKQISYPLYDLSKDEKFGLCLNFSRLQRLRPGYGYDWIPDSTTQDKASDIDGVFLIDIEKNTSKLIISLKSISKIKPHKSMIGAEHYINHLSWNPIGSRFLFFHLWTDGKIRSSRLFTSDKNGENIYLLENKEVVSHYSWKDNEFICMTTHSKVNGLRYSIYKDQSNERNIIDLKSLTKDGHPTFHPSNQNILLSDTYPDKFGERKLFFFDIKKDNLYTLGDYESPLRYRNDYRCDLHPRWNVDGTLISFDSTHTNKRTLNIIEFENPIYS